MPYYRLFFLDDAEHVIRAEVVACASDAQIEKLVRGLAANRPQLKCPAVEVWQSESRVGRFMVVTGPGAPADAPVNGRKPKSRQLGH